MCPKPESLPSSYFAIAITLQGDTYPYIVFFQSEAEDATIVYCRSVEEAVTVHPTGATWTC